jgi:CBS domain-containing protein
LNSQIITFLEDISARGCYISQKLRKIMVENVVTVKPNDTVKKAAELMNLHGISSLIVVDSEKPVGIITERDMLNRVLNKSKITTEATVKEIMSKPVLTASPDMRAGDAAKLMIQRNIKKLPIVENGRLVGLVSLTDLVRTEGVIQFLNKLSLNGASVHIKKTLSLYFDQGKEKKRKCPLIAEQGFHMGCQEAKCMWWTGEDCAVTCLSRQFSLAQMPELP